MAFAIIYLDMPKAFYRVTHPHRMSKVDSSGITDPFSPKPKAIGGLHRRRNPQSQTRYY